MIKRTLYFGNPAYLSLKDKQILVSFPEEKEPRKAPIEDTGIVILDHARITITQPLISSLLDNNIALVTCNGKHMPQGMLLNLEGHHTQQANLTAQIETTKALKDRLWKQVIQQKIENQAGLLQQNDVKAENMLYWAKEVNNGDPENYEGRAAANYWKKLFDSEFIRGRFEEGPNVLLNYGYAILRAIVARSLVGSGLHPSFGIHHHNKYNAYCLADDMMEPYRPFVDQLVLQIMESEPEWGELTTDIKSMLLLIPTLDVVINKKRSPLMVAVQQTTASLVKCYLKEEKKLKLPKWLI
jgi:CRISPR-associated protein Cas1